MRVLHINCNFDSNHFYYQYFNLGKLNIKQDIFYPFRSSPVSYDFQNLPIEYIQKKIPKLSTKLLYKLKIRKILNELLESYHDKFKDINIIHGHTLFSDGYPAYILSRKFNTRYIVSFRKTDLLFIKYKPWLRNLGLRVLQGASSIVCITYLLKQKLLDQYPEAESILNSKISVISNGISESFFLSEKAHHTPNKEKINLLYIGRFRRQKNVHKLIRFVSQNPNLNLSIIGGGGHFNTYIERLLKKAPGNIEFYGWMNDPKEIIKTMNNQDIFIMISSRETFGIAYVEAMSQKLPIIYSRNTGIYGTFDEGVVGFGVDPDKPSQIIAAINNIVSDYRTIAENCYKLSLNFRWEKICSDLNKLYLKVYNEQ